MIFSFGQSLSLVNTHTFIGGNEWPYLLLWRSLTPLNTKQHWRQYYSICTGAVCLQHEFFLKWGNWLNADGGLKSSELQILEVDCCWTPGCYTVKMFNQNESHYKPERLQWGASPLPQPPSKEYPLMNGCSRDKAYLFA